MSDIVNGSKVFKLSSYLVVIAFFGFLHLVQIFLKFRGFGESGAVDTGKHLVFRVASPVGAGYRRELKGFYRRNVHKMRACAKVGKLALSIKAYVLALVGVFLAQLNFIRLSRVLQFFHSLGRGKVKLYRLRALFNDFFHLRLDFNKIIGGKRGFHVKIIIETIFNSWSYC